MLSAVPSLHCSRSAAEKRSAVKISQELHHCPRGTCSSGGESPASRSVDRNPHHKTYYLEGEGRGDPRPDKDPMTSFAGLFPPTRWIPAELYGSAERTDRRMFFQRIIKAGETKQGGRDVKGWESLCPWEKLTFSLCKGRYYSVLLPGMYLPEVAQSKWSSQGGRTVFAQW